MLSTLRVLLVEDSEDDAMLIARHLERGGYSVEFERVQDAPSLRDALERSFDVVIIDYRLPSLNGLTALLIVRKRNPDVPIILASGAIGEEQAVEAMRAGAGDFVTKDNLARLVPAIERELREAEIRRRERAREIAMRDLESQFRATFEQTAVGIAHGTPDGVVIRVNRKFASMLGYAPDELQGRRFAEFTHPDHVEKTAAILANAIATGEPSTMEKCFLRRDGQPVWTLATFSIGTMMNGDRYVIGVLNDISERKAAVDALRKSEELYRQLMEHASDGILIADGNLEFIDANSAICSMLGCTREQILGRHLEDLHFPADVEAEPLRLAELFETQSLTYRRIRRVDNSGFDAEISSKMLPDGRIQLIVRDITERKRTEEKLCTSEQRFRLVAQATNDGILDIDFARNIHWFNEQFVEILGPQPAPDQRLEWWAQHIYPEDRERVLAARPLRGDYDQKSLEYRWLRDDGRLVYLSNRYLTMRKADGVMTRLIITVHDATEEKRSEEALRRSEARFRRVFDSNIIGVHFWTLNGAVTEANDAYLNILDVSREEFEHGEINWRSFTAPEYAEITEIEMERMRKTGTCGPFEKEYVRRDGSRVRVIVVGAGIGGPDSGVALVLDITERERAAAALRASEALFRATIENSYDIVAILDAQGRTAYESPAVERLLGYKPEELIGTTPFERIHPDDLESVRDMFTTGLQRPRATATAEFRYRAKDGTWHHLESIGHNLLDEPGINGIIVNSRDITERRAYEKRLAQAERVASLGRLAATVAHEFNNVLMGIQPFAEVIRRKAGNDVSIGNACKHIETSVQRGRRMTQEILRFTRPIEPAIAPLIVAEWLTDITEEMKGVVSDKHRLALIPCAPSIAIAADRALLTQAITNLVVNARDAMPTGGAITITAAPMVPDSATGNAFVAISVSDTGSGIPEADRERIFEPLYTTKRGGTGLGLPLTHQIVARHGGSITLDTELGRGTTFHLFLPRYTAAQAVERQIAKQAAPSRSGRILIVEDEALVAEGLSALLETEGFSTKVVTRGLQAEAAIEEFGPQLVVLDVGLPDIDGIDLHQVLARRFKDLDFVFSTGHADLTRMKGVARERCRLIQKPYEIEALVAIIDELLQPATV